MYLYYIYNSFHLVALTDNSEIISEYETIIREQTNYLNDLTLC